MSVTCAAGFVAFTITGAIVLVYGAAHNDHGMVVGGAVFAFLFGSFLIYHLCNRRNERTAQEKERARRQQEMEAEEQAEIEAATVEKGGDPV